VSCAALTSPTWSPFPPPPIAPSHNHNSRSAQRSSPARHLSLHVHCRDREQLLQCSEPGRLQPWPTTEDEHDCQGSRRTAQAWKPRRRWSEVSLSLFALNPDVHPNSLPDVFYPSTTTLQAALLCPATHRELVGLHLRPAASPGATWEQSQGDTVQQRDLPIAAMAVFATPPMYTPSLLPTPDLVHFFTPSRAQC
jgi:hypothetical protein